MTTQPSQLLGILRGVTASWFRATGRDRVPYPVHVWLTVEGLGTRKLHTSGAGSVAILDESPHASYDIDDHGNVEVEPGSPGILAAEIGQTINATSVLWQEPPGAKVGFILHFSDGKDVGIANLGDDLVIEAWPDRAWSGWGVSRADRHLSDG